MKLKEQLYAEAEKFGIEVEESTKEIMLLAPDGFRFEADQHSLVIAQWDDNPMPNVWRDAIKDVQRYGPLLEKCPDGCSCKECES